MGSKFESKKTTTKKIKMSLASSQIVWMCVKDNHANRVQVRPGVQFSKEKGNLLNFNTRRHSGYQNKSLDISKQGKSLLVSFKTTKNARKPARLSKVNKFRQPGIGQTSRSPGIDPCRFGSCHQDQTDQNWTQ